MSIKHDELLKSSMSDDMTLEDFYYEREIEDLSKRDYATLCHVFHRWSDSDDETKRSIYENIMRKDFRVDIYRPYLIDLFNRDREEFENFFLYSNTLCDIYEMYDDCEDIYLMLSGDGTCCPHPNDEDFPQFIEKAKYWYIRNTPLTKAHSEQMKWWLEDTEWFDPPGQEYVYARCYDSDCDECDVEQKFKFEQEKICRSCWGTCYESGSDADN